MVKVNAPRFEKDRPDLQTSIAGTGFQLCHLTRRKTARVAEEPTSQGPYLRFVPNTLAEGTHSAALAPARSPTPDRHHSR